MTLAQQFHHRMYLFHQLCLPARIGAMPRSEHMILEMLLAREAAGQSDTALQAACIARQLHVSAPAVSRTMRHLRESGLIEAEPDPHDRRSIRARVTDAGRAAMEADRRKMDAVMARAIEQLAPGEAEQFIATFDRLLDGLSRAIDQTDTP